MGKVEVGVRKKRRRRRQRGQDDGKAHASMSIFFFLFPFVLFCLADLVVERQDSVQLKKEQHHTYCYRVGGFLDTNIGGVD